MAKNFWIQNCFGSKILLIENFLDNKFLAWDSFGPKFFEQKQQPQPQLKWVLTQLKLT